MDVINIKNETYEEFVDKFKPKLTTDDCYTPENVYQVIKDFVCEKYGIDKKRVVRPFWPGADYKKMNYDGKVVIDNPPFSILSKILEWYSNHNIDFFLFAPSLICFSLSQANKFTSICCGAQIRYENGAIVSTSFITSLGNNKIIAQSCPELTKIIEFENKKNMPSAKKKIGKYEYPDHVVTAAMINKYSKYGINYQLLRKDCMKIRRLDMQCEKKKVIYGGGFLLSEKAAAEKAAAEKAVAEKAVAEKAAAKKAAAEKWLLSDRELEIVKSL